MADIMTSTKEAIADSHKLKMFLQAGVDQQPKDIY